MGLVSRLEALLLAFLSTFGLWGLWAAACRWLPIPKTWVAANRRRR